MSFKVWYEKRLPQFLNDKGVCKENRELFRKFFAFEEYKLKRTNGLTAVDERSYKTLVGYFTKLRNVNLWFKNKPWTQITEGDIRRVYDALEDGKILTVAGKPLKDTKSYYNKVFRSKPFELAGKAEIARQVIEFYHNKEEDEVRFIEEETFRKLIAVAITPRQKLLLWLAFDIGENVGSLLDLQKKDFLRRNNASTREAEYIVNLPREKLKRSRKPRSEITNFQETVDLIDIVLADLSNEDQLFDFGHRMALKFLDRAVAIVGAQCIPKGQKVSWKDLRSSMACHLLKKGWSTDEIKARLGHKPSSRVLDKYVSYLAIDRHAPKKKLHDADVRGLRDSLKDREDELKRLASRQSQMNAELESLREFKREIEARLESIEVRNDRLVSIRRR